MGLLFCHIKMYYRGTSFETWVWDKYILPLPVWTKQKSLDSKAVRSQIPKWIPTDRKITRLENMSHIYGMMLRQGAFKVHVFPMFAIVHSSPSLPHSHHQPPLPAAAQVSTFHMLQSSEAEANPMASYGHVKYDC